MSGKRKKKLNKKKTSFKRELTFLISATAIVTVIGLSVFNVKNSSQKQVVLGIQSVSLDEQKVFWENVISVHPTYIDAWLELARVAYELGDKNYAIGALNSAISIDPNSEKVKKVSEELGFFDL